MRQKKFALNTLMSLVLQLVTMICGFILPRMIMSAYGSNINGMISSITQFLSVIAFLEFGVGAVIQSALYKPLVDQDNRAVSEILVSGNKFFRKIATAFFFYIIFLIIFYPFLVDKSYGWIYSASLIFIMSISNFLQYYFGIIDGLLLSADQKGYIQYSIFILTNLLSTIICGFLVYCGASIHFVKGAAALIYLIKPFLLRKYINKYYTINRKIKYKKEPITQKWNGAMQHIAYMILNNTDIIVLTLFSTLANVSIYSAYNLVVSGLKQLFTSLGNGFRPLLGELWVRKSISELNQVFGVMEWVFHTAAVFVFGCASVLMIPFIVIYTQGIIDANYVQPVFSIILIMAYMINALSSPYWIMILAAGHFKETQWKFLISAILNMVISLLFVWKFGLVGVAVGTLIAMVYQDFWMIQYVSKHLNHWSLRKVLKQFLVDAVSFCIGFILSSFFQLSEHTYIAWGILTVKIALIWAAVLVGINLLFYRDKIVWMLERGKEMVKKIKK